MYSIGDLARLGGVTPRMLRHYDDRGVFVPRHVDGSTGYRRYAPEQLADLFRVLALKDLGFTLAEVKQIVDGAIGPEELRGMLRLRRTELESDLAHANTRLGRVEQQIERLERQMTDSPPDDTTVVATKSLPAVHLATTSGVSPSFASVDIGPVIRSLYPVLFAALDEAGVEPTGPSIAFYDDGHEEGIGVHAGFPVSESVAAIPGLDIVDLPPVEMAATAVHIGDMAVVDTVTIPVLFDWMRDHGMQTVGYSREVYLSCPDDLAQWRTEMQFPIESA